MQKRTLDILSSNLDHLVDDWIQSMNTVLPAETWNGVPIDELSSRASILVNSVIEGLAAEMSSDFSLGGEVFAEAMKMGQRSKDRGYELQHLVQEFITLRERLWALLRTHLRQSDGEFINTVARMNTTIDQLLLWSSDAYHTAWVEELEQRAITDGLTGIFTHGYFARRLDEEVERGNRYGHPVTLLMIDLDGLKVVNDRFGHLAGDAVLRQVASLLVKTSRRVDIVARYGGDEFGVIMPQTNRAGGECFAERTARGIASSIRAGQEGEVHVTVSIGMATYPGDADTARGLIEVADREMYRAKAAGGNMVRWSEGSGPTPAPDTPTPSGTVAALPQSPHSKATGALQDVVNRLTQDNQEMDEKLEVLCQRLETGAGFEKSVQDTVVNALRLVSDMRQALSGQLSRSTATNAGPHAGAPKLHGVSEHEYSAGRTVAGSRTGSLQPRAKDGMRVGPLAKEFRDLTTRRGQLEKEIERMLVELQDSMRPTTPAGEQRATNR